MPRSLCDKCCRPLPLCLCAYVTPVQSRTHVLVLQHPDESRHALNTARLAVLGLPNSQLWVGEYFPDLPGLIRQCAKAFLLFPGAGASEPLPLNGLVAGDAPGAYCAEDTSRSNSADASEASGRWLDANGSEGAGNASVLIVPDGTWRKARKILYLNPVLQTLPRLALSEGEPSRYRIRKAPDAAAISTIEAITRTLSALEPERDFTPLLKPFDVLIDQQIDAMGPDIYAKHHQKNG